MLAGTGRAGALREERAGSRVALHAERAGSGVALHDERAVPGPAQRRERRRANAAQATIASAASEPADAPPRPSEHPFASAPSGGLADALAVPPDPGCDPALPAPYGPDGGATPASAVHHE
jgi:hypothetical protein